MPLSLAHQASRLMRVEGWRRLRSSFSPASIDDFRVRDIGTCDPQRILRAPDISLYCLDLAGEHAVFVRAEADRLADAPFLFQAQARFARELISVPFAVLHDLASSLRYDPTRLALIYSTGRCGSTLVSRALWSPPSIVSLSEPDVFTNLTELALMGGVNRDALRKLVRSCTLLQLAPHLCHSQPEVVAIKPRSFAVSLAELLEEIFPDARTVFLYRSAAGYFVSIARAMGYAEWKDLAAPAPRLVASLRGLVPLLARRAEAESPVSAAEVFACMWISVMRAAITLAERHADFVAIRYEDMQRDLRSTLRSLLAFLGAEEAVGPGLESVLATDAQAGTRLARSSVGERAHMIPHEMTNNMLALLATIAPDLSPEVLVHSGISLPVRSP